MIDQEIETSENKNQHTFKFNIDLIIDDRAWEYPLGSGGMRPFLSKIRLGQPGITFKHTG
jgi:hypothetical protein